VCISNVSSAPPVVEKLERLPPFVLFDAQEMIAFSFFKERYAFGHLGVTDDNAGLRFPEDACRIECADERIDVVSVHALHMPPERGETLFQWLKPSHLRCRAIRLLIIYVNNPDKVIKLPMARRPSAFPDRAFSELAIGKQAVNERV
jgi:hypothetical protein